MWIIAPRYEPMQPFAPEVSKDYGEAEVINRNNPVVYGAGSDTARMRFQAGEAAADRAARERASARAAHSDQLAILARKTGDDYQNIQQGMNLDAQRVSREAEDESQRQLAFNQLEFQRARAQAEMEHDRNQLMSKAAVDQMLFENKLTFTEKQRLAQRQNLMSEIAKSPRFTDVEKRELMRRIESDNQIDEQRLQKEQIKNLEVRNKMMAQEMEHQGKIERRQNILDAKSAADRTVNILDDAIRAEVEAEPEFSGPITKDEIDKYGARAPLERKRKIENEVIRRGGLKGQLYQTGVDDRNRATYAQIAPPKEAVERGQISQEDVLKTAAQVAAAVEKEASDVMNPPEWASKPGGREAEVNRRLEQTLKAMKKGLEIAGVGQKQGRAGASRSGGGGATIPNGPPAKPYNPGDRGRMTNDQISQEDRFEKFVDKVSARQDLAPEMRQKYVRDAQLLMAMYRKYGSFTNPSRPITAQDQQAIDTFMKSMEEAESPGAPPPQTAPPQQPKPQYGPNPAWGRTGKFS